MANSCGHGRYPGERCKECRLIYLREMIKIKHMQLQSLERELMGIEFEPDRDRIQGPTIEKSVLDIELLGKRKFMGKKNEPNS